MLLNKVLKKMKDEEKAKNKDNPTSPRLRRTGKKYPTSKLQTNSGFHAKASSLEGAARQRSMGNRMYKPSN
jgi:hypothetical protein